MNFCTLGCTEILNMSKLDTEEAFGRGTMGDEIGFEASARKGEGWILLVAIH